MNIETPPAVVKSTNQRDPLNSWLRLIARDQKCRTCRAAIPGEAARNPKWVRTTCQACDDLQVLMPKTA